MSTEAVIHPIFAECCADEGSRQAMQTPWIFNGYRYATDGSICVRQPCDGQNDSEVGRRPDASAVFNGLTMKAEAHSLDGRDLPALIEPPECDCCYGTGCRDCPTCGNDEWTCSYCGGSGRGAGNEREPVLIDKQRIALRYAWILKRYGMEIYENEQPNRPLRFTGSDGIEGLVAPIRLCGSE